MISNLFEIENSVDMDTFSKVFTPDINTVIKIIRKYGFDLRIVGGAVRDFLLGTPPRDIDFATDAEPAELIFIFDLEGIEYDAGGIQHGTVKAVFGDDKIDVTSITYKMKIKNNRVNISRPDSWKIDSLNRDLTINSMSVDLDGNLYDYQNGQHDLTDSRVKYCPDAQEKINTDPLTILRWFKALAYFDNPKWLVKDRELIEKNAKKITQIKNEDRTKLLLAGLLKSNNKKQIFNLMCDTHVAQYLNITCDK